jgi:hypothetical protein
MAGIVEGVDRTLGRLIFRAVGLVCAAVTLVCAYVAWRYLSEWQEESLAPVIMFSIAAVAAGSAVPFCFSRKRTLGEALDAMEGGVADAPRKKDRK